MAIITSANRSAPVQAQAVTNPHPVRAVPAQDALNNVQDAPGAAEAPKAAATPATPPADERLGQLARKERALQEQRKALATEKAEVERMRAENKPKEGMLTKEQVKQMFAQDPSQLGLTMEELGQVYLAQANQSPESQHIRKLETQLSALQSKLDEFGSKAEASQTQAYNQALKQISTEVDTAVSTNDAYEIIRASQAQSKVVELIEETWKEDGTLMTVEQAASEVEAYLEAQALSLANTSKLKAKLMPASAPVSETAAMKTSQPPQTQPTTLTQALVQASSKPLTAKDRRERAILAAQGKLNK